VSFLILFFFLFFFFFLPFFSAMRSVAVLAASLCALAVAAAEPVLLSEGDSVIEDAPGGTWRLVAVGFLPGGWWPLAFC
jgi:hypothetical protein